MTEIDSIFDQLKLLNEQEENVEAELDFLLNHNQKIVACYKKLEKMRQVSACWFILGRPLKVLKLNQTLYCQKYQIHPL